MQLEILLIVEAVGLWNERSVLVPSSKSVKSIACFRDVRKPLTPEAEERIQQGVKEAAAVMTLHQLREARSLTQVNLAKVLQINQGAVSKMEKRADMYVSTLRNFIQAMGGQLQVKAIFPEGKVQIDQFENVAKPHETSVAPA